MDAHRSSYTYCTRVRKRKFLVSDVQWSTGKGSISQYYLSVPISLTRSILSWPLVSMAGWQSQPMLALQKSVKWRMRSIPQSWPCWLALQFKTNLLNHENSKSHNKCLDRAEQQPHVFYFFVMFCSFFFVFFFVFCFLFFVFCFLFLFLALL